MYNKNRKVKKCYGQSLWAGIAREGFGEKMRPEGTVKVGRGRGNILCSGKT